MTNLMSTESYAIGWIAALPIERAAATAQLDDRHEAPADFEQHPSDTNAYTWGRIGKHNVVIASLPAGVYGTTAAATTTSNVLASLPAIKIGLLVGIGGGIPRHLDQDLRLGDVVVSQPEGTTGGVIQYDLGKARPNEKWEPKGMLNKPPQVLLSALAALQAEHEIAPPKIWDLLEEMLIRMPQMRKPKKKESAYVYQGSENDRLFSSWYGHIEGPTCDNCDPSEELQRDERDTADPEIHYGIIASGNTLVKDASTRDKIAESAGNKCLCVEMEAAGLMDHFPCLVIRGICDYADSHKNDRWQRYASATAAAYAKELLEYVPTKMLESTERAIDLIKSVSSDVKDIQSTATKVQLELQDLSTTMLNSHQKIVLDRLRVAEGASFDSYAQEHNRYCLPETRVELLRQIAEWAEDLNAEPIFWLNGMAGTGKSTISRTVARLLADKGQLGASFFFKKGEADRGSLSKFFMTIAADLVVRKPSTAPHIEAVLIADRSITSKNATEQFQKFLLEPLSKSDVGEAPVVIVVDALDECEQEDDIKRFLYLVSRFEIELPDRVRIFLTSRPEGPFRSQFEKIQRTNSRVILHEIPEPVVEHDIDVFLRYELSGIRAEFNSRVPTERHLTLNWPSQSSIDRLVKMAVPLFIVAATICRFISDKRIGIPGKLLEKVLSRSGGRLPQLETTYRSVLDNLTAGASASQQEQIIQEFRQIVGSIVLLASPLSTTSLTELLSISKDDIDSRLDLLHSVLDIPTSTQAPVRLLHLSFRDFLLNPDEPTMPFRVDGKQTHANLAAHCLRILGCLKKDLCNIKSPGTPRSDINVEIINSFLPPELQYSCLHWAYHLEKANIHLSDGTDAYAFLTKHFLHWMEALALMGRVSDSLGLLRILQSQAKGNYSLESSPFLEDAIRFIQPYMSTINLTPLQLYSSLLIFTPKESKIRNTFEDSNDRTGWICLEPRMEEYWNNCLRTLEGHSFRVTSVVFSCDSTLVASGSYDRTVRIWRADTGECVQTLAGHSSSVTSVAFSHDSMLIASGSDDRTVQIRRAVTGECVQVLRGHRKSVTSVVFSHDSSLVASGSQDRMVRIWRADTGECLQTLRGHRGSVTSVVFSHQSRLVTLGSQDRPFQICIPRAHHRSVISMVFSTLVASGSQDRTVRIWRAVTGKCVQTLAGHSSSVTSVAFSHDSTLVASGSGDETVRIWRADTGECVRKLRGHSSVTSVVFSHNSTLVASGLDDRTVRIWRVNTGKCTQTLAGHSGTVTSVVFSHDSTLVASGSGDETVRIWCADADACVQTLAGHSSSVMSVVFSRDSTLVASGSQDRTVRIWRADTGECMQTLRGHRRSVTSVVFSHDSTLVASGSGDETVRIWRADTGECVRTLLRHSGWVMSVAFSHDSTLIASGSDDRTVQIRRADTGECVQMLRGHSCVTSVIFSHNSTLVASGSQDRMVRIWRADTGECAQTLRGHSRSVTSVVFSHDSTLVASGSQDRTVRIWLVDTGECVQTLDIGRTSKRLVFSPDSSYIITDFGAVSINGGILTVTQDSLERSGVGINENWITWGGRKLLWLPVEFRPHCAAVSESTVAIGSRSGKVIIVGLSADWPS